jgi:hypothetical protein
LYRIRILLHHIVTANRGLICYNTTNCIITCLIKSYSSTDSNTPILEKYRKVTHNKNIIRRLFKVLYSGPTPFYSPILIHRGKFPKLQFLLNAVRPSDGSKSVIQNVIYEPTQLFLHVQHQNVVQYTFLHNFNEPPPTFKNLAVIQKIHPVVHRVGRWRNRPSFIVHIYSIRKFIPFSELDTL